MKKFLIATQYLLLCFLMLMSCSENNRTNTTTTEVASKVKDSIKGESPDSEKNTKNILFFGNSLTAGLGIDTDVGFVNLIQTKLTEKGSDYRCINAGLSGETTAGGKNRINWVLKNNEVAIFVLELGGNDGLRGIDPKSSKANLQSIIDAVMKKSPNAQILLAGMEAPPNMGASYTDSFRSIYKELKEENTLKLIPFLLERVGGIQELNQADGIHPNEKGQILVAENIWKYLEPML